MISAESLCASSMRRGRIESSMEALVAEMLVLCLAGVFGVCIISSGDCGFTVPKTSIRACSRNG